MGSSHSQQKYHGGMRFEECHPRSWTAVHSSRLFFHARQPSERQRKSDLCWQGSDSNLWFSFFCFIVSIFVTTISWILQSYITPWTGCISRKVLKRCIFAILPLSSNLRSSLLLQVAQWIHSVEIVQLRIYCQTLKFQIIWIFSNK